MFKSKKIRKNEYPGKPQFYYIKVGCKGVYITRTCFHDDSKTMQYTATYAALKSHIFSVFPIYFAQKIDFGYT